ncbi:hypothetical protein F4827_006653 [Paraburkholderia bannensis]|uniref:Uncharacterized protein n=1 Tax=Paraburkholderia bannensis TaxID=765414 RepID=A0A7W9U4B4_9BURK|nr:MULTISPECIES: hypothetical protein [Paraburkholderia]MBB3261723.1 hypothetical protein [Paraburkholderia sp. WP4_3_2]MBB6106777.1 hypothetical protein [Paraburkholderia bannensis]
MANSRRLVCATSASPVIADDFVSTITALRPASGHERAELISDLIDAFRRLRNSIERFNRMLAHGEDADAAQAAASLQPLLATLSRRIGPSCFAKERELKRAIRDARRLDKIRNALFSDAFCLDTEALRCTVAELERLDATFVGLGVEHVLAQHATAPAGCTCEAANDRPRPAALVIAATLESEPGT